MNLNSLVTGPISPTGRFYDGGISRPCNVSLVGHFQHGESVTVKTSTGTYSGFIKAGETDEFGSTQLIICMDGKGTLNAEAFRERTTTEKENIMHLNEHKVTIIEDEKRKVALIYVQIENSGGPEMYLIKDGRTMPREMGGEMPIWETIPLEIFRPMVAAARKL